MSSHKEKLFHVLFITAIIVGAAVGATTSIVNQWITNGWNNINWWQVGWDSLIGGISGALSVTGLGVNCLIIYFDFATWFDYSLIF